MSFERRQTLNTVKLIPSAKQVAIRILQEVLVDGEVTQKYNIDRFYIKGETYSDRSMEDEDPLVQSIANHFWSQFDE